MDETTRLGTIWSQTLMDILCVAVRQQKETETRKVLKEMRAKRYRKDQIRKLFEKRFSSERNMRWEHQGKWICGDRVVLHFIVIATLDNGEEIRLHGCDLMQMRGNKVAVKDTYWKSHEPPL